MSDGLPPEAYAAALAGFELMTLRRLAALLRHHTPAEAFEVAAGRAAPTPHGAVAKVLDAEGVRHAWSRSARRYEPAAMWERCAALDVRVLVAGSDDYPDLFRVDAQPPPVVFARGDLGLLDGRRVAVVGTRNATAAGRHLARTFGRGLAAAGVQVVSGLARGIDGQAHAGAFDALDAERPAPPAHPLDPAAVPTVGRPVAVVASGHDVVYPKEHHRLWYRVADDGLLLSEWPPGSLPLPYRFPQRNRLVAALSEIVVVVESRETGGSLITAQLAAERGIPVMAAPGSQLTRAALGVNALLRDGSAPVLDVDDVLVVLGLDHRRASATVPDDRVPPRPGDLAAYRVLTRRAGTVGEVAEAVDVPLVEAAMSLARLEQQGWIAQVDGWFEAVGSPFSCR